jgi:bacteriocin biosynthesis cyclodehydratase domain-containing protein
VADKGVRLRLKRQYSIVAHSNDVVELRHGTWNPISFTLRDDSTTGVLRRVLERLDGSLSTDEIADAEGVSRSEIDALVEQLADLGLLEDGPSHALDYYLDHAVPNLFPYPGARGQARRSAVVVGKGGVPDEVARILGAPAAGLDCNVAIGNGDLHELLSRDGSGWLSDGLAFEERAQRFADWRDRFVVFASSTVDPVELRVFNRIALRHRIPWLHAAIDGPFLLVGPTFIPGRSSCYECLETRVLMNLREAASYQAYKHALAERRVVRTAAPLTRVLEAMAGSLSAFEALNFLVTEANFTVGKMLAVYLPTFEFSVNEVLRLPGCSACGSAPERDDRELYFDIRTLLDGER